MQCTSWGTHVTSGIPAVDYYLSSELIETEESDAHYSETLVRFPSFPSFQRRPSLPKQASRGDFGLPESGSLYLCPQRLAKFIPDNDRLLRGVLDGDGESHLVILEGKRPGGVSRLHAFLRRTLGRAFERVITLPNLEYPRFLQLLMLGDAILDFPNYSLGVMAFDALAAGIPVVTLPGRFHVGRYMGGLYRKMGLDRLVARSQEEYVDLAVSLGRDRDFREAMQDEILERSGAVFEDAQVVRDHETFFTDAVDKARTGGVVVHRVSVARSGGARQTRNHPNELPKVAGPLHMTVRRRK